MLQNEYTTGRILSCAFGFACYKLLVPYARVTNVNEMNKRWKKNDSTCTSLLQSQCGGFSMNKSMLFTSVFAVAQEYKWLLSSRWPDERQDFLNDLADLGR